MGDDSAIRLKIYAQSLSCLCTIGVMVTFLPSKQKLTVRVCYGALGFISFTYRDKNGNAGKHVCYPGVITPISSPRRTDLRANIRLPIFEYNVGYLYTVNSTRHFPDTLYGTQGDAIYRPHDKELRTLLCTPSNFEHQSQIGLVKI